MSVNQPLHNPHHFAFASDNYAGVHPTIMDAIITANGGHQTAYGDDIYNLKLSELIAINFGENATSYPVFNGTGANIIALSALTPRHGAVICTNNAHIYHDESNAPAYVAGLRLLPVETTDGKLTPAHIKSICQNNQGNPHAPQPTTVYISQVTELGTCYTLDELSAITATAKSFGLHTYLDGARLANACAYLGCTLSDIAATGVDILTLGGTKNGMMMGECVVVLNPAFDGVMPYLRKNHLHLASKHRFISAQFVAWLDDELWLKLARHSNQMAQYLYQKIKHLDDVNFTQPVQSNAVFLTLPKAISQKLHQEFSFYDWNAHTGEIRLVMSFDTTTEQIDHLAQTISHLLKHRSKKPTQIYPKANLVFSSYFTVCCPCGFTRDLHKLHRRFELGIEPTRQWLMFKIRLKSYPLVLKY